MTKTQPTLTADQQQEVDRLVTMGMKKYLAIRIVLREAAQK